MSDSAVLPAPADIVWYLKSSGWLANQPGPGGTLWVKGRSRIGVPNEPDDLLIRSVLRRLAEAENRGFKQIADAVRYVRFDVTHLRAVNDSHIVDKIPLVAATKLIGSARMMLRATATTARWERAQIGGSYSKIGDEVIQQAFMGHTERGSFVIPVLIPIPEPEPPDPDRPMLFDSQDGPARYEAAAEPFARRVVRTFAQSMQAVHDLVVAPERSPSTEGLHELVYRGVSREFCSGLANVLDEKSIGEFETTVDWAPLAPAPNTMPRQVSIGAEAGDLVRRVAERLRQQRASSVEVFSGTIVEFRHENQDDPFGEVAVSTIRRGRQAEIRVRLPVETYREAWEWHNAGRAVLVEGIIRRPSGRPGIVDNPARFQPLDALTPTSIPE
ncbi:hypothetical protein [Amycolatopsis sp. PS_44_ISF1]|uniref:hypothetical protein n=1 Tax=Amycolatopsis sp. PS_44_ISF1 TaxID=2974917 RepID=UPI0028DDF3C8|nr:hypothetical protein [Amycolatopsis sp. PS_44_ISF1]MDT8913728.1 hypothetical protein [Amycolatopsis sp. PS_44_ISF1]MDT8916211.1 hypothetical protein [Amycolatopsis sp. PS_44_ISF1]